MTTRNKNFKNQATPSIVDTEYRSCNFSQAAPIIVDGKRRGVRIFPGDDTPRIFTDCNFTNAEPPPGSTLTNCLTAMIEYNVDDGAGGTKRVCYGRYDPATDSYVDLATPKEFPDTVEA